MSKEVSHPLTIPDRLPVWELPERVVFPYAVETLPIPLPGARPLLEASHANGDLVVLMPRSRERRRGAPHVAVLALLLRMGPGNAGEGLLVVQGVCRARLRLERRRGSLRWAQVEALHDHLPPDARLAAAALRRSLLDRVDQLTGTSRGLPSDAREFLRAIEDPGRFADAVAAQLALPFDIALRLLAETGPVGRMNTLLQHLSQEVEITAIQEKLTRQAREEMDKRQRDYFLRQQLEAIQSELAGEEGGEGEVYYRRRLKELDLPPEVAGPLEKEVAKLARYGPFSEEASQVRGYLDLVLDLPWLVTTTDRLDLKKAQRELDEDHYGLKKAKARILEHLAVSKLKGSVSGTIFCFVGPPGVGKTSLGRAIARALGRKFVRMSLGGVRDEAEIRGHRRTYVGAMPGRIVQGIKNAGSRNPVFVLDEVDKMGNDWRGDPSAALLEALDPQQNREFVDHYLGFPFDLSRVMFIATANTLEPVHPAFVDRMEILELSGYTEEEKLAIARRHLLPRQIKACGLEGRDVAIPDETVSALIRLHTREAGVRNLERALETVLRKLARRVAEGRKGELTVRPGDLDRLLGPAPFFHEDRVREDRVGVVPGLAWTEVGGEILYVEAAVLPGTGALTLTGQLGDVMKESVQAALTYLKEHGGEYGLKPNSFAKKDVHVHVPQGSVPKDGPSAGITMAVALLSAFTGRAVDHATAFTGEITLRGDVLPVGGLREKLLAAHRGRMKRVILPAANRHEHPDFPKSALKDLQIVYVKTMDEVFKAALK